MVTAFSELDKHVYIFTFMRVSTCKFAVGLYSTERN
jgi:hypothetical protein